MKKINFWAFLSLFVAIFAFTACSSSDDPISGGGGGGNKDEPALPTNGMATVELSGIVTDGGMPLFGVTVTSGSVSMKTGTNGAFTLNQVNVVNSRAVVKFQKEGYMDVTRSLPIDKQTLMNVDMVPATQTKSFNTTDASNPVMNISSSSWLSSVIMKVELPTGDYKKADGSAYSGQVNAKAVYLNPNDYSFANKMPGDLSAIRADNSEAQLVSLGMVAVDLTGSAGESLQLPDGKTATLTFPVPENAKQTPETMPLWSFDENTGLWVEEGVATFDAVNNQYVGTVTHFSWHNLDYPEARAELKVKVVDASGSPISNLPVNIDGQREVWTNSDGIAKCVVPSNTLMNIMIDSDQYGNYAVIYDEDGYPIIDETKLIKQEVILSPQETKEIVLTMTNRAAVISGTVTNEGGSNVCTMYISYGNYQQTNPTISDFDGKYAINAPVGYTGKAILQITFGNGTIETKEIELNGSDQTIDIHVNNSSAASAGYIQIEGDGLKFMYKMPDEMFSEEYFTYRIEDGKMYINGNYYKEPEGEDDFGRASYSLYIEIPNYDENQTTFANTSINYNAWDHSKGGESGINGTGTLTLTKNGDVYNFVIKEGKGEVYDRMRNLVGEEFNFSGSFATKMSQQVR